MGPGSGEEVLRSPLTDCYFSFQSGAIWSGINAAPVFHDTVNTRHKGRNRGFGLGTVSDVASAK